jgi:hypothetical protein
MLLLLASSVALSAPPPTQNEQTELKISQSEDAALISKRLVIWIMKKTEWKTASVPEIRFESEAQLATLYFGAAEGFAGVRPGALYWIPEHILFLSRHWNPNNEADQSILLHELVHHLQAENKVDFECRMAYEWQAYKLQAEWLREKGYKDPYKLLPFPEYALQFWPCP